MFTEFYCQSGGSNLNAGSDANNAARLTYASGTWVAATGVFTVAAGNPSTDGVVVGDFASIYADGSTVTGFVGRVTAVSSTTITVSLTAKSGTAPVDGTSNRTLKIGGAWQGPNAAEAFPFGVVSNAMTDVAGDGVRVNFKSGSNYAITAGMTHSVNSAGLIFSGYTATPGDGGRAVLDGGTSGTSYTLLTISGSAVGTVLSDLIFQNNGATGGAAGVSIVTARCQVRRCVFHDFRGHGLDMSGGLALVVECEAYLCNQSNGGSIGAFNLGQSATLIRCIAHDNTTANGIGFRAASFPITLIACVADSNGSDGFQMAPNSGAVFATDCDAYNNGGSGFRVLPVIALGSFYLENCNAVKNAAYGINCSAAVAAIGYIVNCGFGSGTQVNTSGTTNALSEMVEIGSVNYPVNVTPWIDPANGDFRINLASAKATGRGNFTQTQASYGNANMLAYPDIGAVKSQSGAGGNRGIMTGGRL